MNQPNPNPKTPEADLGSSVSNARTTDAQERPILFSAPMVRALLAGRKTQTRRALRIQPTESHWQFIPGYELKRSKIVTIRERCAVKFSHTIPQNREWDTALDWLLCPYGQPGDRLWGREAWQYAGWTEDGYPWIRWAADGAKELIERGISEEWSERLMDIWADLSREDNYNIDGEAADRRWRPGIHMPRWACRILLEVTDVRVERLQDISGADAVAEGIQWGYDGFHVEDGSFYHGTEARLSYASLWESINGEGSWDANPWVWCVSFRAMNGANPVRPKQDKQAVSGTFGGE